MSFRAVWAHQLRWARTIRVSQPVPYFFSILSNVTLWALLLMAFAIQWQVVALALEAVLLRITLGTALMVRLTRRKSDRALWWLLPVKDLLQCGIWLGAFVGNSVEWAGQRFRLTRAGKLVPVEKN